MIPKAGWTYIPMSDTGAGSVGTCSLRDPRRPCPNPDNKRGIQRRQSILEYFTPMNKGGDQAYHPKECSLLRMRSKHEDSSRLHYNQQNLESFAMPRMYSSFSCSAGGARDQTMFARTVPTMLDPLQSGVSSFSRAMPIASNFIHCSQPAPSHLPPTSIPRDTYACPDNPHLHFFMPGTTLPPPPTQPTNPIMLKHSKESPMNVPFYPVLKHQLPMAGSPDRCENITNHRLSTDMLAVAHSRESELGSTPAYRASGRLLFRPSREKELVKTQQRKSTINCETRQSRHLSSDSTFLDAERQCVSKAQTETKFSRTCLKHPEDDRCHLASSTASGPTSASREFESPRSLVMSTDLQKPDTPDDRYVGSRSNNAAMPVPGYSIGRHNDVLSDGATAKTVISNGSSTAKRMSSTRDLERREWGISAGRVRRGYQQQMLPLSEGPENGARVPNGLRFLKSSPLTRLLET